ncbi:MAG: hypothetical protein JXB10_00650 [Pirellulales bacterium]|nr:hypothetical protein [Pirellulales bacterium]
MFRQIIFIVVGAILAGSFSSTGSAAVHVWGHPHPQPQPCFYPYPYYDFGGWGTLASAYEMAGRRRAFGLDRQLQLESSLAQNADWRTINQSLQFSALVQRPIPTDAGQAARDWMYEMQRHRSLNETKVPPLSSASCEIMLWPTLLKGDAFTVLRNQVEAPFRRAYAERRPLTAEDYQGIIQSLEAMKMTLRTLKAQVLEAEYALVEDYLDGLLRDAEMRLDSLRRQNEE